MYLNGKLVFEKQLSLLCMLELRRLSKQEVAFSHHRHHVFGPLLWSSW